VSVLLKTAVSVDPVADFQLFQSSAAEIQDQECDLPHLTLNNINTSAQNDFRQHLKQLT